MTIDKLAIMVAKGFDSIESRIATKDDVAELKGDVKDIRKDILTVYTDHLAYDRKIDNLTVRVEKLETK